MKFGCCPNMAAGPDGIGGDKIGTIARLGYDYAELSLAPVMALDNREFSALFDTLEKSGLQSEACNNFFPPTLRLTGNAADPKEIRRYYRAALPKAAELGAKCVVFGSGPAKMVPAGFPMEQARRQLADLCREMDETAGACGITIVIEPLRRQECNLINTYEDGCRLAGEIGCENIRVLVDFYHLCEMNEPVSHIVEGSDWLCHAHFARIEGRTFPKSRNEDPRYERFFDALKRANYGGRLSVESYPRDFEEDARAALELFRGLAAQYEL